MASLINEDCRTAILLQLILVLAGGVYHPDAARTYVVGGEAKHPERAKFF